uniref:Uncharacterized protein n=1 Tax=Meloidogyne enterolobii TaxID=390850 RepID=A0A6V7XA23_MELEN|nr:unnamed protein product [Meloidogyne enterolobii]
MPKIVVKNGEEKHGIEFRVYGTRVGFEQSIEDYYIEFNVAVIVGFSFSTKTIVFNKTVKATGKVRHSYTGIQDERLYYTYLDTLNREESYILIFSIQLGNNGKNFAILTDEMNGNVYDYGNYVLSNFGNKSIQEIVEEDGAIAMIGPDMNLEGKLLLAKNIQFLPVTPESCSIHTVDIKINNVTIEKEISCYRRSPNICDQLGLEEYNKQNKAFSELLELYEKCPCYNWEPRPPSITDDRLNVPPGARNKRNVKNDTLLGTRDAEGLVYGCEDARYFVLGDIALRGDDILQEIERQRKCKF